MPTSDRYDLPVLLLRTCVFLLGGGRPEWSRAMLVELAQVDGRRRRWAFALGCIRCLAFTMPPSSSQRVVSVGAFVAAIGSLSVVAVALLRYPGVVSGARTWIAVAIFAVGEALWVVLSLLDLMKSLSLLLLRIILDELLDLLFLIYSSLS